MRQRLTLAILVLVAATLILTFGASYFLIRRDAITSTQSQLAGEARAISHSITSQTDITRAQFRRQLKLIGRAGAFSGIRVVALYPDGTVQGRLPNGVPVGELDVPRLQTGAQQSGHNASLLAYSAIPISVAGIIHYVPVLVVTRQIHLPANGVRYFLLVGAIGLGVAALVAAALARRFSRPLIGAVDATRRIAAGDLDARVRVDSGEVPEFAQLADSINTMSENLVRARDQERQFLLSVSHELRTPLTSIRGYAEAVIDGAAPDPVAAATVISDEARRLERLVQDLLDLARLDADRFSLALRSVDGADVARRALDGFQHRADELGLELLLDPASVPTLWVVADPDRLGQILSNLLENAGSYAERRIVVGAGIVPMPDRAGGAAAIWVVDDGRGIRPDELPLVFDRHFSSDRVQGRRKGTGLGLAIVSELAGAMGATVKADSPVVDGKGTRMVLWLRTAPPAPAAWPALPSPSPPRFVGSAPSPSDI